jgi:hypothetical protein
MSLRLLRTFLPAMLSAALTIAGLVLFGLAPRERVPVGLHLEESYPFIFMQLSLGVVGAAVAWRQPRNPIGWLLSAGGLAASLEFLAAGYMTYGLLSEGGLPWADVVSWFWSWGATLVGLCVVPVLFLFPDGHLRSRHARVGIVVGVLATLAIAVVIAPRPGPMLGVRFAENPFGWRDGGRVLDVALVVPFVLGLAAFTLGANALRTRYRIANDLERQQLKWLFGGVALWAATYVVMTPALFSDAFGIAVDPFVPYLGRIGAAVGFSIVPVAIGIAILRYRLYEIDMLIKRTLVYATTSAAVAATFFLGIVALQRILRPLISGSELAIAASTLISFALFQPIRRRIQDAVNRRFDRSRYDTARTLDAFVDRLRDEVDLDAVRTDLLEVVRQTMAPQHVSLWLRRGMPGMGSNPVTISGRPAVRKELA